MKIVHAILFPAHKLFSILNIVRCANRIGTHLGEKRLGLLKDRLPPRMQRPCHALSRRGDRVSNRHVRLAFTVVVHALRRNNRNAARALRSISSLSRAAGLALSTRTLPVDSAPPSNRRAILAPA